MTKPSTAGSQYLQDLIRHAAADPAVQAAYVGGPLAVGGSTDPYAELELHLVAPREFRAALPGWLAPLGEIALLEETPSGCRTVTTDGLQVDIIVSDQVDPTGLQAVFDRGGAVGGAEPRPAPAAPDPARAAASTFGAIYRAAAALGRGLTLTAHAELEAARAGLLHLYRLALNPANPGQGWIGADQLPGAKALAGLQDWLVCPLELQAQWRCAHRLATTYESLVLPLTERLGLTYPWAMRNLVFQRLDQVREAWAAAEAEARGEVRVTAPPAPEAPAPRTGPARFKVKGRTAISHDKTP